MWLIDHAAKCREIRVSDISLTKKRQEASRDYFIVIMC